MKKLVLVTILMLVPFTAFALDTMTDSALDKLTAQEGVTITFDDVAIHQTSSDMAWSDADGADPANSSAGSIFIGQTGTTDTTIRGSLTIDVATATAAIDFTHVNNADPANPVTVTDATIATGTSFVKIGLPDISQSATAKTMTICLKPTAATANTATNTLGTLYQNAGSSSVSGDIYIYAH